MGVLLATVAIGAGLGCRERDDGSIPPGGNTHGDVVFSIGSRAFLVSEGSLHVALSTDVSGTEIRYTTDRTLPTASSPVYDDTPIAIAKTTTVRARAFFAANSPGAGSPAGRVTSAHYIARDFDARSDIPIVVIDGYGLGPSTSKDIWLDAAMMVFEPGGATPASTGANAILGAGETALSATPTIATDIGYHLRGAYSARLPQKSYRVEFHDESGSDRDLPLLGMPAESDWALIAPYYDRALIRNPLVYDIGREISLSAPRVGLAEVYVNTADRPLGAGDYLGVYNVVETVKNAPNRLNLKQLGPADRTPPAVTGGFIMKFDWGVAEDPGIPCTGSGLTNSAERGTCFSDLEVVDPDPLGPEQQAYLTQFVQAFHDSLHATPIGDYASLADGRSLIDNFIVNELVKNIDEFTRSAYYHKDRDGKLIAGPLWDYNFSLDCGREPNRNPEGWQYTQAFTGTRPRVGASDWYVRLTSDSAFMAEVARRWKELRQGVLSQAALDGRISALAAPLANAAARDIARWPVEQVFTNSEGYSGPTAPTWEGQVQAIRDWLTRRIAWIDAQFP